MAQAEWLSKSAVARMEHISRRTVQRTCRLWESLPGKRDYLVTDAKGRVSVPGFKRFRAIVKQTERRGFPPGRKRSNNTGPWRELEKRLRNQTSFGKTYEEKINLIRREIEAMPDSEQRAFLWDVPGFCREAARKSVAALAETLKNNQ